ncbi:MAG: rRNA maturation RNase YbeY [Cyclobacteriaceae bacterium]
MLSINFFAEDVPFELADEKATTNWITDTVNAEGQEVNELSFVFCSDEYLHQINVQYLNHDYFTDIITFDNSDDDAVIEGDIFMSIDRIEDNARNQSIPFITELHRVIIHGVLHLLGYDDKSDEHKKQMREKENAYLSLCQFLRST